MKRHLARILCAAVMLALAIVFAGCSIVHVEHIPSESGSDAATETIGNVTGDATGESGGSGKTKQVAQVVKTGSGVTVSSASDWASEHPDIYASYMKNADNSEQDDYVQKHPEIAVLYEGMAFNQFYNSARGHTYAVEDVSATGRPHALANCFTCKTPNFTATVNELGDEAYRIPFEEMSAKITEPISCYNCHANEPGTLIVTHTYLADAMGSDLESVDPAVLACAQCHVEYHFDPDTKAVTLPYSDLGTMNPDSILEYYNTMDVDGQPFADYTNPRSGVRQIKAQHPEFETYMGEGSVHAGTFNCADCHMPAAVNAEGQSYISHEWVSPLDNADLVNNNCAQCHTDLAADVNAIQSSVKGRTTEVGHALEELTEALVLAVDSGDYTDEELNAIRSVYRDAQFYWDFVFVENSYGAHNSKLTNICLDKSEKLLNEAKLML